MILTTRFKNALRSPQPAVTLRGLVNELSAEGFDKPQIVEHFQDFLVRIRTQHDFQEADEEVLLEILDALTGWCHPDAELLRDQ